MGNSVSDSNPERNSNGNHPERKPKRPESLGRITDDQLKDKINSDVELEISDILDRASLDELWQAIQRRTSTAVLIAEAPVSRFNFPLDERLQAQRDPDGTSSDVALVICLHGPKSSSLGLATIAREKIAGFVYGTTEMERWQLTNGTVDYFCGMFGPDIEIDDE